MGMIFFLTFYFDTHFPLKKTCDQLPIKLFKTAENLNSVYVQSEPHTFSFSEEMPLIFRLKAMKFNCKALLLSVCLSVCLLLHVMSWANFHTKSLRWCLMGVVFLTFLYFSFPLWCSNYSSSLLFTCSSCFVSSAFVCLILPLHFIASPLCLCRMFFFIKHN